MTEDDTAARIMAMLSGVQDAINNQVSPTVQHNVDQALTMPEVGSIARAVDPIAQAIRDAIASELTKPE